MMASQAPQQEVDSTTPVVPPRFAFITEAAAEESVVTVGPAAVGSSAEDAPFLPHHLHQHQQPTIVTSFVGSAALADAGTSSSRTPSAAAEQEQQSDGAFTPPLWQADEDVSDCVGCNKSFDWGRRRHHCRCCGRVFCAKCSAHKSLLPRSFGTRNPQRVCSACNLRLEPLQEELIATLSNAVKANQVPFERAGLSTRYLNRPVAFTMGAEVRKAATSVLNFCREGAGGGSYDSYIPTELLARARGLAFITILKVGFGWVGSFGTGLVVARLTPGHAAAADAADGAATSPELLMPAAYGGGASQQRRRARWSAPSAIGTVGMGWGAAVGANVTDVVLVLMTEAAVEAFAATNVSLGAGVGVAAGPLGRSGTGAVTIGSDGDVAPVLSYSHSRGLFAGISLEGAVIASRSDVNRSFYGRDVSAKQLLQGDIPPPIAATPLYEALAEAHLASRG